MIDVNNMDQFFSVIDPSAKDEAEAAKVTFIIKQVS